MNLDRPNPLLPMPLRWLPFSTASLASVAMSAHAPDGRKSFHFDPSLAIDALAFSAAKGPHIGAAALLGLLAVLATGRRRLWMAFALTLVVGAGWELGQTTVFGHTARLSDLLPDAIGAAAGCAWGALVTWLLDAGRADLAVGRPLARRAR